MTEKRIDYLARMIINHKVVGIGRTKSFLRAVATEGRIEGREEGINELRDAMPEKYGRWSMLHKTAERLKADGKR